MRSSVTGFVLVGLLGSLLVPASTALAAGTSYTVTADMPTEVPAGHNWAFDDYFPRALTVAQGDTVTFAIESFHTATLLPAGTSVKSDLAASGLPMVDTDETGRNPNGTVHLTARIAALMPQTPTMGCGTTGDACAFDGSATVSSGVPQGPTGSFTVTVTAPAGTYLFHCRVHPNMVGTLRVVASGGAAETTAQADAAAAAQLKVDVAEAYVTERMANSHAFRRNPNGSKTWLVSPGAETANGHVSLLEMLPLNVAARKGDRILWVAHDSDEPHTITFPVDRHGDLVPQCEVSGGTDIMATPTVIPPTGPQDFACASMADFEIGLDGGNGVRRLTSPTTFADSGFISTGAWLPKFSLPSSDVIHTWSVNIEPTAVAGTYTYVCQIHDGMHGTIVVH